MDVLNYFTILYDPLFKLLISRHITKPLFSRDFSDFGSFMKIVDPVLTALFCRWISGISVRNYLLRFDILSYWLSFLLPLSFDYYSADMLSFRQRLFLKQSLWALVNKWHVNMISKILVWLHSLEPCITL